MVKQMFRGKSISNAATCFTLLATIGSVGCSRQELRPLSQNSVMEIKTAKYNAPTAKKQMTRLELANAEFHAHSWDKAIYEYNLILRDPSSLRDRKYAMRRISLSDEYKGVQAKEAFDLSVAASEFRAAIKIDPSNIAPRRLLREVTTEAKMQARLDDGGQPITTEAGTSTTSDLATKVLPSQNGGIITDPEVARQLQEQQAYAAQENMAAQLAQEQQSIDAQNRANQALYEPKQGE